MLSETNFSGFSIHGKSGRNFVRGRDDCTSDPNNGPGNINVTLAALPQSGSKPHSWTAHLSSICTDSIYHIHKQQTIRIWPITLFYEYIASMKSLAMVLYHWLINVWVFINIFLVYFLHEVATYKRQFVFIHPSVAVLYLLDYWMDFD